MHPAQPVSFGIPNEWREFERRHAHLLQAVLPPLFDAATKVFARTIESEHPHERIALMLGRHVPEDFNEVFLLCANGYGIAALKLLRSMYERVVTMVYLLRNPSEIEAFTDWHLVEKRKMLNRLKDEGDEATNYLTAEEVAQIEADYERVSAKFPKKQRSWTRLDLRSMARKVGLDTLYLSLYVWPSWQIHTTAIGMTARVEETEEAVSFKIGPQREDADRALLGAHTCLLMALAEHTQHFGLAVSPTPLFAQHKDYWDRAAPEGRRTLTPPVPSAERPGDVPPTCQRP